MPSVDTGEIFICELITKQVQADNLAKNKGPDIKEKLDKGEGVFSLHTLHKDNENDIYGIPAL